MEDVIEKRQFILRKKRRVFGCEQKLFALKKARKKIRKFRRRKDKLRIIAYIKRLEQRKQSTRVSVSVQTSTMEGENSGELEAQYQGYTPYPLKEIEDFNKQHDVAYWKSRALSLELENKMLLEHIKKMCSQRIQEWVDDQEEYEEEEEEEEEYYEQPRKYKQRKEKTGRIYQAPCDISAKEKERKTRLYGDQATKIVGMETALQLHFDTIKDKCKPKELPCGPY